MKKTVKKDFLTRALSATGDISAKRLTGFLLIIACIVCMIWLTVSEGGTMVVESLLQTSIITGCSLLGLSSVTSIWRKDKKIRIGGDMPDPENNNCKQTHKYQKPSYYEEVTSSKEDN